ncbi:MAG: 30S ribosomal protein S1 [Parcubacteria group bacterium CG10_big_fil_rev_8_21_14_0_10_41_35]|nr:MAG: 30S ribosomal protein S1 [Parcubacteria group bacterium CG10_big_fil_rev_8_21_14_0_10_41_35]
MTTHDAQNSGQEAEIDSISEKKEEKGHNATIRYSQGSGEMDSALKAHSSISMPKQGELLQGTVLDISKNGIIVDINGTLTGLVRGKELDDESGQYSKLNLGEKVEATVLDLENEQGILELSFRQAGHRKAWNYLSELLSSGEVVDAKIIDANKGGLMVKVGNVEGFLPVSQLTVEHYPRVEGGDKNRILDRLKAYANELFRVKVITVREKEEKLIVSEKAAWEKEQNALMSQYKVGDTVKGRATGVVDFGVFVEFGDGLEGLIHISELAWQRIDNPSDVMKVGDEIEAKIISMDDGRVSLSRKKLVEDPWKKASEKYKVGDEVEGIVLKINPYGAFVELDKDIHGLAHVSEVNKEREADLRALFKVGEKRKFKILSIEPAAHRLGLGII